jgi:hypothetical protein
MNGRPSRPVIHKPERPTTRLRYTTNAGVRGTVDRAAGRLSS